MAEHELRKSMQHYGQQHLSEQAQINLLHLILADAKSHCAEKNDTIALISHYQAQLKAELDLTNAIKTANRLIIELEAKDKAVVNYLKKQGLYRILYRKPLLKGQELPTDDILPKLLRYSFIGVLVSALIMVMFITTVLFTAPVWLSAIASGLFVGASVYLGGMLYGVVNDLFATHANLPYFLLGHQYQQTSLLRTNDKVAQGIAWGMAATFGPVVIAAALFTVVALITAIFVPLATFILPVLILAMPLIALGAEFYAQKKANEYLKIGINRQIGANVYQRDGLSYMSPTATERAAWYANSDRNMFGFTKVPFIGLAGLAALVILSAISALLPPMLFISPILAVAIPVACAGTACIALLGSGIYMYANRNIQHDDRYRLDFSNSEIEPGLYLDEDMDYINELVSAQRVQKDNSACMSMAAQCDFYATNIYQQPALSERVDLEEKITPQETFYAGSM